LSGKVKSICLVCSGLQVENYTLQPWRYIIEVGRQFSHHGYHVTFVSDGRDLPQHDYLFDLPVVRLPTVHLFPAFSSSVMEKSLREIEPDFVLLHVGLTSFLHQDFYLWHKWPTIGIFASPIYTPHELWRLGLSRLWSQRSLAAIPLLGAVSPRWLLRWRMQCCGLRSLVVETHTTCQQLIDAHLWSGRIDVIPPGVDEIWSNLQPQDAVITRRSLGYTGQEFVVGYFGSPSELRGLPLLIHAVERAHKIKPAIKLLVLSRRRPGEMVKEARRLQHELKLNDRGTYIQWHDGFMTRAELVKYVASCNLVAFPFELVPSDAPLGLLEASTLGIPLITSDIACLPELASHSQATVISPGDLEMLTTAIINATNHQDIISQPESDNRRAWELVGAEWVEVLE
jgi:glycosyltransferase involved in cell wall biosynthesis